jgi:hypothetical protein
MFGPIKLLREEEIKYYQRAKEKGCPTRT